jgi:crotonobetainyl-CoA:carnitine CoA-transferase CaiB-like acyl-CoA transferase
MAESYKTLTPAELANRVIALDIPVTPYEEVKEYLDDVTKETLGNFKSRVLKLLNFRDKQINEALK